MPISFTDQTDGRYDRQAQIEWWDQAVLAQAHVVVAGAGAIGNENLKILALLGIGSILVVDFDTVSRSNLSRTLLFRETDVGKPKARLAAERASDLNPDVSISWINGDIGRDLGLGALREADFVLGGLDSINARRLLNQRCLAAGIPWSNAGISENQGQLTRYHPESGACYECTLTSSAHKRARERFSCTGLQRRVPDHAMPTTAVASSLIASLQVQDLVCYLHGRSSGLRPGHRLTYLLDTHRAITDELPFDPQCPAHLPAIEPSVHLSAGPEEITARDIAAAAEASATYSSVHLGFDLLERFDCARCGTEKIGRPSALVFDDAATCPQCGAERVPHLVSQVVPDSVNWDVPLADLGVAPQEILVVSHGDGVLTSAIEIGGLSPWAR